MSLCHVVEHRGELLFLILSSSSPNKTDKEVGVKVRLRERSSMSSLFWMSGRKTTTEPSLSFV